MNTRQNEHGKRSKTRSTSCRLNVNNSNLGGISKGLLNDETMIRSENIPSLPCYLIESNTLLSVLIMIQERLMTESQINFCMQLSTMIELNTGGFITNISSNGMNHIYNELLLYLSLSIILFFVIDTMIKFWNDFIEF